MGEFNLHKVKRQARKEAWYDKPGEKPTLNPFKRTRTTPAGGSREQLNNDGIFGQDLEAGNGVRSAPNTQRTDAEPLPPDASGAVEKDMSNGSEDINGRTSDPTSETIVPRDSTNNARPPSQELKARRRFINRFTKRNRDTEKPQEDDVTRRNSERKSLKHPKFTVGNQLRGTLFNSWINVLIICAPVGIILNYIKAEPVAIFVVNFIAIIPLAALLSYATEEIALRIGETLGGLMNATFGNAVELIVAILALIKKEIIIVQTSLIGSMLSNLLLVMGMCFFFGGLRRSEQYFNVTVAGTAASLLALAVGSLIIPTAFAKFSTPTATTSNDDAMSRGTAIILFLVYCCYLYFQLHTHSAMFAEQSQKVAMKPAKGAIVEGGIQKGIAMAGGVGAAHGRVNAEDGSNDAQQNDALMDTNATLDDEPDEPQLHLYVAIATLVIATVIIALCAEFMVDSIGALTNNGAVSEEFVGLILLPIVGNAAEHATAVTVACKDKMDLAIGVAVGSSMQVALLVIPIAVILGWILHVDMNLVFDGFLISVLFVSVLLVNYLIGDGKSHWLEGVMLMALYVIIAVSAWYYPAVGLVA